MVKLTWNDPLTTFGFIKQEKVSSEGEELRVANRGVVESSKIGNLCIDYDNEHVINESYK